MQLSRLKNARTALLTASCSLLGAQAKADDWKLDTAIMYYGETDRVTAVEGIVQGTKEDGDGNSIKAKLVIDALTGASANGAVAQPQAQTFTSPSGNGQYDAEADETPLDDTFRDTRVQLNGQWTRALGRNRTFSYGLNGSNEYDYRSLSFNGIYAQDFNEKNNTLSLGLSYAFDQIEPVGGKPVALSSMVVDRGQFGSEAAFDTAFELTREDEASDDKSTVDVLLGLTQVINRRWVAQFNVGLSEVDGYLTDPYKVVSIVDAGGIAVEQRYESRPESRSKTSLFAQSKYHFDHSVLDVSYRYNDDDWGIKSHTIESRYRINIGDRSYLEPHLRYYQQSAADFYQPFILDGQVIPEFVSADYRIGKLNATTVGLKWGKDLKNNKSMAVRLEWYKQSPQDPGVDLPGVLNELDIYPELDALVLQFNYSL